MWKKLFVKRNPYKDSITVVKRDSESHVNIIFLCMTFCTCCDDLSCAQLPICVCGCIEVWSYLSYGKPCIDFSIFHQCLVLSIFPFPPYTFLQSRTERFCWSLEMQNKVSEYKNKKENKNLYIFIFKSDKNYVIGWYLFFTVYITKYIYSMWNNNLRVKIKFMIFSILILEKNLK